MEEILKNKRPSGRKAAVFALSLLTISVFISCDSILGHGKPMPGTIQNKKTAQAKSSDLSDTRAKLVEAAEKYRGASSLTVRGRRFAMDCSSVVSALYYYAGIDLADYTRHYTGSGTERIYKALDDRGLLHKSLQPEPGDIIFWDNTYDANNNRKADDYLTHTGMVVSGDREGNIVYIHYNYAKGIVFEHMNLKNKSRYTIIAGGKEIIVNSPMRMKGSPEIAAGTLSGQLFRIFGSGVWLD